MGKYLYLVALVVAGLAVHSQVMAAAQSAAEVSQPIDDVSSDRFTVAPEGGIALELVLHPRDVTSHAVVGPVLASSLRAVAPAPALAEHGAEVTDGSLVAACLDSRHSMREPDPAPRLTSPQESPGSKTLAMPPPRIPLGGEVGLTYFRLAA